MTQMNLFNATCPKCGLLAVKLTRDHIIPKWIYKASSQLNLTNFKKNLGEKNIQMICAKCNGKKSGKIDVSTELGRIFWTQVRDSIDKELKKQ